MTSRKLVIFFNFLNFPLKFTQPIYYFTVSLLNPINLNSDKSGKYSMKENTYNPKNYSFYGFYQI
jgi:hypothetical protein